MSTVSAKVFNQDGTEKGTATLPEELFGQPIREHLMWLSVKRYMGNQRQGTAKVKGRSEVAGGGRKPWRQKGTGRARAGTNNSPLWPGGGRAFGPKPRDYRTKLPSQQRKAALTSALSLKAGENAISLVEALSMSAPKTAEMASMIGRLGLDGKRTLLVLDKVDENVVKSCRNLKNVDTMLADQVHPYQLLRCDAVLLTSGSLERMKEVFKR